MRRPMTRMAAAAVVVVTCVLAFSMWQDTGSIALADVVAKVGQIQAYLYRTTATIQEQKRGNRTARSTVLISNLYGIRTETTTTRAANGRDTQLLTYVVPKR